MIKRDLSYGAHPEEKLDLYLAETGESAPLFVFFHGGGLEGGNKGDGKIPAFCELMNRGISVATADYRMYPSAKFPDFIEDAAECVRWCRDSVPHASLWIGGSSAGAYLSLMLAADRRYLEKHGIDGRDGSQIAGYFCDSGQPTVHFNVLRERGMDSRLIRVDEAAPVYFVNPVTNPEKRPKLALIVSDHDMVNRLEQNRLLYRTLVHFGYPEEKLTFLLMEGYGHTGYNGAIDADGIPLYAKMIERFLRG